MIRFACYSRNEAPIHPPGGYGVCGYVRADDEVRCDGCAYQPVEVMLQRCLAKARKECSGYERMR